MASIRQAWHEVNAKLLTATIIPTNSIILSFDFLVNYLFAISARFEIRCKGTAFARESLLENPTIFVGKSNKMHLDNFCNIATFVT